MINWVNFKTFGNIETLVDKMGMISFENLETLVGKNSMDGFENLRNCLYLSLGKKN